LPNPDPFISYPYLRSVTNTEKRHTHTHTHARARARTCIEHRGEKNTAYENFEPIRYDIEILLMIKPFINSYFSSENFVTAENKMHTQKELNILTEMIF